MPVCQYFIANTFAHLLGGLVVTGVSTENPIVNEIEKKPLTNFCIFLISLPVLFLTMNTEPGIYKYILFIVFCILLGQTLVGLTNKLNLKGQLSEVLTNVALVFATMCTIGLADNQNMLSWGTYLYSCLIVLIVSFVLANFIPSEAQQKAGLGIWLSRIMVVLFALFIGFDVEVLKQHAKVCKSPDYVNESLNLYLDIINLFNGISGSE